MPFFLHHHQQLSLCYPPLLAQSNRQFCFRQYCFLLAMTFTLAVLLQTSLALVFLVSPPMTNPLTTHSFHRTLYLAPRCLAPFPQTSTLRFATWEYSSFSANLSTAWLSLSKVSRCFRLWDQTSPSRITWFHWRRPIGGGSLLIEVSERLYLRCLSTSWLGWYQKDLLPSYSSSSLL